METSRYGKNRKEDLDRLNLMRLWHNTMACLSFCPAKHPLDTAGSWPRWWHCLACLSIYPSHQRFWCYEGDLGQEEIAGWCIISVSDICGRRRLRQVGSEISVKHLSVKAEPCSWPQLLLELKMPLKTWTSFEFKNGFRSLETFRPVLTWCVVYERASWLATNYRFITLMW